MACNRYITHFFSIKSFLIVAEITLDCSTLSLSATKKEREERISADYVSSSPLNRVNVRREKRHGSVDGFGDSLCSRDGSTIQGFQKLSITESPCPPVPPLAPPLVM
ncbi:hypothetical protein AVEN_51079-1 [Araneus ventricosus]|uniref:Uncharacterized protein n=1 Tax=Araneus ventricosus TaxID=182803 RepID=A0A4Y2JT74_ARAVE|nr:hypothetical protein AVEN_51079-1 [Araneus ventricosus]